MRTIRNKQQREPSILTQVRVPNYGEKKRKEDNSERSKRRGNSTLHAFAKGVPARWSSPNFSGTTYFGKVIGCIRKNQSDVRKAEAKKFVEAMRKRTLADSKKATNTSRKVSNDIARA